MSKAAPSPISRLRKFCLSLPEAHEAIAWGEPTFRVRNKLFAMYAAADNHHGSGRPAVWIKAAAVNQQLLLATDPARYFFPAYVGPTGWIGVWLDRRPRWREIDDLLIDGYRMVAPKKILAAMLRDSGPRPNLGR
jgi:hypothetical protein